MSEQNRRTRRQVLQSTGCCVSAMIGASGLTAAKRGRSDEPQSKSRWITVEGGRFVLNVSTPKVSKSALEVYQNGVDNFNTAIEKGYLRLEEPNKPRALTAKKSTANSKQQETNRQKDRSVLRGTEKSSPSQLADLQGIEPADTRLPQSERGKNSSVQAKSIATSSSCNRDDVEIEPYGGLIPGEIMVRFYLSDGTINDLNALVTGGSMSGPALRAALIEKGIISAGAISATALAAITVAVAAEWGWILYENDGCGVVIHTGYSPVNPTYQIPTVSSQG